MKDEIWDTIARTKGFLSIKDMVKKLYTEEGLSDDKIAEKLECSTPTVRSFRLRFDIASRKIERAEVKIPKRDLKKLSCRELEEKYKISRSTAWRLKKQQTPSDPS